MIARRVLVLLLALFTFHFSLFTLVAAAAAQETFAPTAKHALIDPPTWPQFSRWVPRADGQGWQYQIEFSDGWWVYTPEDQRWYHWTRDELAAVRAQQQWQQTPMDYGWSVSRWRR